MGANLLTIGDMLAGITAKASALPKSDASGEGTPFSVTAGHKPSPVETAKPKTPYNNTDTNTADARSKSIGEPPKDFSQALREEAKSEAPQKTQNSPRLKGQGPGFNAAQQPDIVQAWRAMNSAPVEQSRDGAATRIEPKAGRQLAELIAAAKAEKSPPAIGKAAQSVEIKPLPTTDKGPLGLNSVSPEIIRHTPAATIQPAEAATDGTISSSNETVIDTEAVTRQDTHAKVLAPEVPADTGGETIAETSPVAGTPAAPAANIKSPMPETPIEDGGKATDVVGSANTADARITTDQAGPSETQPELVAIDPDKSLQAAGKEPTVAETSPVAGTPAAPAANIKSPMPETPVDDGGKATEAPQNTQNSPKSNGQGPGFNTAQQPDIVQAWRAMNSVPVEQSRDGAATRIEPKAGRQLAELIAAAKAEKSPPDAGHTVQSVEIRPLPTTDKDPLGLDSVSPGTPRHTPAAIIQPAEAATDGTVSSSNETLIDTEAVIQQGTHVKGLVPEVPADTGGETIAETSPVVGTPTAPAPDMNSPMPETPVDDGGKATDAPQNTQNSPRLKGQGPGFNAAQQPDIVQAWRAMNSG
ncbi:MAG: hypothetical protein CEE38_17125, partial [Planctomycetes bacterium B3_Pla]